MTHSTLDLLNELKENGQDHEWYPTTTEIINALGADIRELQEARPHYNSPIDSILDIGAGNGKVLIELKRQTKISDLFAIEKSSILCREMPEDILVVGTDFDEQSLLSKSVAIIFCNPPYSEYERWSEKILRQAAAGYVYLVIPERWKNSTAIKDAIQFREGKFQVIGSFDFLNSEDRQARARVDLIRFNLDRESDPFAKFFQEQFADLINNYKASAAPESETGEPRQAFDGLVVGPNYPEALVNLYGQEMAHIHRNYQLVNQLDVQLLKELDVDPLKIMKCLKGRLDGLRNRYWHELFSHLKTITDRLTSKSRQALLNTLHKHVQVDFTVSNIYEVVIWVIKNANKYIDAQLLETYEQMVAKCNVHNYKSNQRVWIQDRWRYSQEDGQNSHYYLDYRIVASVGGIAQGHSWDRGLAKNPADFLGDLLTIARNLGFQCETSDPRLKRPGVESWTSGSMNVFYFMGKKCPEPLLEVRAFLNGNLHLRLHQSFISALNVEHGRLRGWLHNAEQAVDELGDKEAAQYFKANVQLCDSNPALLLCQAN